MWRPHRWVVYRRCRVYCRGLKVVGVKCTVVHQLPFLWWPRESFTWLSDTQGMPEGDAALPYIPLTNYTLYTDKKCPLVTNEQTNFNSSRPKVIYCWRKLLIKSKENTLSLSRNIFLMITMFTMHLTYHIEMDVCQIMTIQASEFFWENLGSIHSLHDLRIWNVIRMFDQRYL